MSEVAAISAVVDTSTALYIAWERARVQRKALHPSYDASCIAPFESSELIPE